MKLVIYKHSQMIFNTFFSLDRSADDWQTWKWHSEIDGRKKVETNKRSSKVVD